MKRWTALSLTLVTIGTVGMFPVTADANHGLGCVYTPATMVTYNCSALDLLMIDRRIRAALAEQREDWTEWSILTSEARVIEENADRLSTFYDDGTTLNVSSSIPLEHYQTIDSIRVGPNIRYATASNNNGGIMPRFIVHDILGRQTKISGISCTTRVGYWINFAALTTFTSGAEVAGLDAAGRTWALQIPTKLKGWAGIGLSVGASIYAGLPQAESCIVLVDVLNPEGSGYAVYRNRSTVTKDGQITVHKQRGSELIWWRLGKVEFDKDGNPVW